MEAAADAAATPNTSTTTPTVGEGGDNWPLNNDDNDDQNEDTDERHPIRDYPSSSSSSSLSSSSPYQPEQRQGEQSSSSAEFLFQEYQQQRQEAAQYGGAPLEYGIFVSDIARGVTDQQLRDAFSAAGTVTNALVVKNKLTGETKGILCHFFSFERVGLRHSQLCVCVCVCVCVSPR